MVQEHAPVEAVLPPELVLDEPLVTDEQIAQGPPADVELSAFEHVEWAMRKMAAAQARLDALAERYAEMVGRIERWYEQEAAGDRQSIDYFTGLIERYAVARRERHPDGPATYNFPSGKVITRRKKDPTIEVEDEKALAAWLVTEQPQLVRDACRVDVHPRISDLREHFLITADHGVAFPVEDELVPVPGVYVAEPQITAGKIVLTQEEQTDDRTDDDD